MIQIDIVSDVICPWCFIGKRRFERALAAEPPGTVEIGWRPFQLNPDMPDEGMARRDYLKAKFGDDDGGERYKHVIAAGLEEGIPFAFDKMKRTPNTMRAHRLIRYATRAGVPDAVVNRLFETYFIEARDVGDVDVLVEVASMAGLEADAVRAYLLSDEDDALIREEDEFARRMGIHGVPCFVIDRKFMVSGAQPSDVFTKILQRVRESAAAQ